MPSRYFYTNLFIGIIGLLLLGKPSKAASFKILTDSITCTDPFLDSGALVANYAANEQDTTVICPNNPGDVVTLTFTFVDLETATIGNGCWDYLSIYNGADTNAPPLNESLCGELDGDGDEPSLATSLLQAGDDFLSTDASGCLTVVFHSDSGTQEAGWAADVTCAPLPSCFKPSGLAVSNISSSAADFSWTENNAATLWDIELVDLTAGGVASGNPTSTGVTNPYTQLGLSSNNDYAYYVRSDCGSGDLSTWKGPFMFTTACGVLLAPYSENFDTGGLLPICWTTSGDELWEFADGSLAQPGHGGNAGDIVDHTSGSGYFAWIDDSSPESTGTTLSSPSIDITPLTNPGIIFWINSDNEGFSNVDFSIDFYDGAAWNTAIYTHNTNTAGWLKVLVPLTSFTITGPVQAKFIVDETNGNDYYDDFALDDVSFENLPTCLNPFGLSAANITDNSADIDWEVSGTEMAWDYELVDLTAGGSQTMVPTASTGIHPFTLGTLAANNDYEIYIRSNCDTDGMGEWVGPLAFHTLCAPITAPYLEDFDNGGLLPICWTNDSPEQWEFSDYTDSEPGHGGNAGDIVDHTSGLGYFAWVNDSSPESLGTTLSSPFVDIAGLTEPSLIFWINSDNEGVTNVDFSVDFYDGAGWNTAVFTSNTNTNGWLQVIVPLSGYTITGPVRALFIVDENNGANFYDDFAIDDVSFQEIPACISPSQLMASNITTTSADVTWVPGSTETSWDYELVDLSAGATQTMTPTLSGVSSPLSLTNLNEFNDYAIYVRADCGDGEFSDWIGPISFTTLVETPPVCGGYYLDNGMTTAYNSASRDTLTICPDTPGDVVTLTFTFVDIESNASGTGSQGGCWDYLSIYNGNTTISPVLAATLCGELDGDGSTPSVANSLLQAGDSFNSTDASGCLTMTFFSDNSSQEEGWIAAVTCAPAPTCVAPTAPMVANVATNSATFSWTENGSATVWDIELVDLSAGGTAMGNPTIVGTPNPYTNNMLNENNEYEYYVRASCGSGDFSTWVGPIYFMTACEPVLGDSLATPIIINTLPYTTVGNTASCYTNQYTGTSGTDVFYKFTTSSCKEKITVSTCSAMTDFDTKVYLLNDVGDELDSNDDAASGSCSFLLNGLNRFSILEATVQPNTSYYVVVEGFSDTDFGTYGLEITESPTINGTSLITNVTCAGDTDGAITVMVTGGTPPYSYQWNNGEVIPSITGLSPGNYSVIISDVNGCGKILAGMTVGEPAPVAISIDLISNVKCNGNSDGAILITPTGGTPPYTFMWSNGAASEDNLGIPIGTYSLTITDSQGCTGMSPNITLIEPAVLGLTIDSFQAASCNGNSDGAISITVTGGSTPYTYQWSNGSGNQDISGLPTGNYSVTVTDANLCQTISTLVTIIEPNPIVISLDEATILLCNGDSDGSISVSVTGDAPPFTYSWSNGASTEDISNLSAGSYTLTVTDDTGCTQTSTAYHIVEPTALGMTSPIVNAVICNGESNGTIALTASGGTPPYAYLWNNGETTDNISGLAPTNFTLTITDANNCQFNSDPIIVGEPDQVGILMGNVSDVLCNGGSDGSIILAASGGINPYNYLWNDGQTDATATGLVAGDYTATITDANGCSYTDASFMVQEPDSLAFASSVITGVSCNGDSDGTITVMITGGTLSYAYLWSNGETTANLSGLTAGDYSLLVTDDNGCTLSSQSLTLTEPDSLGLVLDAVIGVNCSGGSDGAISITATGGTAPYSYVWNNGATTEDISGLLIADYWVSITDDNGCSLTSDLISIAEPQNLVVSLDSLHNISCNSGSDGSILISITGGTMPYLYAWDNGETTANISGLLTGTYALTLTDANGCLASASYLIEEPTALALVDLITADVSCFNEADGSATVTLSGGTRPYTYDSGQGASSDSTFTGLSAGTYFINVSDANACPLATISFFIAQPDLVAVSTMATAPTSAANNDGTISAMATGGTPPFDYLWSNGATSDMIVGLAPGTFCLTVTDVNDCSIFACDTVDVFTAIPEIPSLSAATLFPNPTSGLVELDLAFTQAVDLELMLVNTVGQVLLHESKGFVTEGVYGFDLREYAVGVYFVLIRVDGGVLMKRLVRIE